MWNTGKRAGLALALTIAAGTMSVQANAASLRWSGDVDDTAVIKVSGNDVRVHANAEGVRNDRFDFRGGALPSRPVIVTLREADGRGGVRLAQQPSERNGYTAVVRITDKDPGRNHYDFVLQWNDRPNRPGRRWDR
ncbi:hypothetical protein CCAX7_59330 [Capsulimonas corticalis]|uniref:Uncharacterized protein n=1 Tax=Capsulimonas corticalis TaxID=2219043 RepID=A0A402CZV2_9BACT|nr:hypothetical protein [Capsulimonas corticalis]BDI33882.1 hypothetical protein CCAX7_59330 [Capsulimonas corticalis]